MNENNKFKLIIKFDGTTQNRIRFICFYGQIWMQTTNEKSNENQN